MNIYAPTRLLDQDIVGHALDRISEAWPELRIPVLGDDLSPEVKFAYSGAEFNDGHGPQAVANLARQRLEARLTRKHDRRARYQRMYHRP
jgi:hypothetical protein